MIMIAPLVVLAILSAIGGFVGLGNRFEKFLAPTFEQYAVATHGEAPATTRNETPEAEQHAAASPTSPKEPRHEPEENRGLEVTLMGVSIALAFGGWGLASAWRSRWRYAALAVLAVYLAPLPMIRAETRSRYLFSRRIRSMVLGVAEARRLHPGKVILLRDVSDELFWNGILDNPFAVIGVSDVYLAAETESAIVPHPELGDFRQFVLPAAPTLEALRKAGLK